LARRIDVPLICLDAEWALEPELVPFRAKMIALHAGDAWISDGNFADATFDIRLSRATLIVWLERPRWHCAGRALARLLRKHEVHAVRDIGKVLAFIWRFDRINRSKIEHGRQSYGPHVPVLTLRNDKDVSAFLSAAAGGTAVAALH
jgi:hypothetical protein